MRKRSGFYFFAAAPSRVRDFGKGAGRAQMRRSVVKRTPAAASDQPDRGGICPAVVPAGALRNPVPRAIIRKKSGKNNR